MNKTITTADGVKVVINTYEDQFGSVVPEYFKYEVLDVTEGFVSFRVLNSPRCTSVEEGIPLIKIISDSGDFFIASHTSPSIQEDCALFVRGIDRDKDDHILTCSVSLFNTIQIAMLTWNVSICKHKTKVVYQFCCQCNTIKKIVMPLYKVSTDFYVSGYSCCPIPEHVVLTATIHEYDQSEIRNYFILTKPDYFIKNNTLPKKSSQRTFGDVVGLLLSCVSSSIWSKTFVTNVCTHCGKTKGTPISLMDLSLRDNYYDSLCQECVDKSAQCLECGTLTLFPRPWGDQKLCLCCISEGYCTACQMEHSRGERVDLSVIPLRAKGRKDPSGRIIAHYKLCYEHSKQVDEIGWGFLRQTPELSYSFKIDPTKLEVLTKQGIKPAIATVKKETVASLEWEFPFNGATTKVDNRDKAIWVFEEAQRVAGYPELFVAKHDGSLPSFATEFVSTRPTSLEMWHRLYFDGVLSKLAKFIDHNYVNSHKHNVGGHIHISKGSFTQTQVTKFLMFLYSNLAFLTKICNRSLSDGSDGYYSRKTNVHPLAFAYDARTVSPEKYTLARVTSNHVDSVEMGTIEVRAFKSPASDVEVIQNIEFMFALKDYVSKISGKDFNRAAEFIRFVKEQNFAYPLLHEKLVGFGNENFSLNKIQAPTWRTRSRMGLVAQMQQSISPNIYTCNRCNQQYDDDIDARYTLDDGVYCESCFDHVATSCDRCGNLVHQGNIIVVQEDGSGTWEWCPSCADNHSNQCSCGRDVRHGSTCTCGGSF